MARIFISHSSRDNDWAIRVRNWLKENGWDEIFLDLDPVRGIAAGERWKAALEKAGHRCEVVLALVSPQWLASQWCKTETDAARLMGKRIVVALIGADKAQIPLDLSDEQCVDLAKDPDGFTRLKEGLRRIGIDPSISRAERVAQDVQGNDPVLGSAAATQDEREELYRDHTVKDDLRSAVEMAGLVPDPLTIDTMLSMSAMRELVAAGAPAAVVARAPAPSARMPAPVPPPAKGGGGFARALPIAVLAIVAAYLISRSWGQGILTKMLTYLNFKLNVFSFLGLSRTRRSEPAPQIDLVDCSVFSPPLARPGSTVLVQVFPHVPQQAERAQFMASMMDQTTAPRGVQTLKSEIARGASVTISLSAAGLDIDEPQQTMTWRGAPVFCQFLVSLPKGCAGESFHPVVRVSVDGGLVGRIVFCLKADADALAPRSESAGESARRYEHAFISYASADRKEVLKRAQVLKAAGVSFFQDILSLDPGTRWEREIYKNIDKCDLVLLFWSRAAKASEWVIREAEYALARRGNGHNPDVVPVILETPPVPPPPSLASLHFNDRIHYLIEGS